MTAKFDEWWKLFPRAGTESDLRAYWDWAVSTGWTEDELLRGGKYMAQFYEPEGFVDVVGSKGTVL